jgi:hypothetical protein
VKLAGGLGAVIGCITVLSLALSSSCEDGSDEPDTACERLSSVLRNCGVLSPGSLQCEVAAGAQKLNDCLTDCLAAANCETVETVVCTDQGLTTTDALRLDDCALQCNERFGFRCSDALGGQSTIPPDYVCDGEADCADASDEAGCELFDCGDGQQVVADFFCDGYADCTNERDEGSGCEHFICPDGTSLPASYRCDAEPDCADGADEASCGSMAVFQCDG